MIKKEGNKFALYSKSGKKKLAEGSRKKVEKREKQIEYFKHKNK